MPRKIDEAILDEIRSRVDIVEFVGRFVELKKAGSHAKGCCPFHHEKTPSFTVSRERRKYHCFGCGESGDIFSFLQQVGNLSLTEATDILALWCGVARDQKEIEAPAPKPALYKALDCGGGQKIKFRYIEPGVFMRDAGEEPEFPDDMTEDDFPLPPVYEKVVVSESFYMGVYPVTQAQYEAVMGENRSCFRLLSGAENHPVEQVNWDEAVEFCRRLSEMSGERVELPGRDMWDYCCQAGMKESFSCGSSPRLVRLYANHREPLEGGMSTTPVGMFLPNAWGIYDMNGNVYEWCCDLGLSCSEDKINEGEASGANVSCYTSRGGSWCDLPEMFGRISGGCFSKNTSSFEQGFRVCLKVGDGNV